MIAAKYNPNADSEQKREVLECGLAVGDASPAELYENAMWLDQGHEERPSNQRDTVTFAKRALHQIGLLP